MPYGPLIEGFVEKLAGLSANRRATLSRAESDELVLATRGGQLAGAALGEMAARKYIRQAMRGLKSNGRVLSKTRVSGLMSAAKATGIVAGSVTASGLGTRKAIERAQTWRRDRMEGIPATPIKEHARRGAQQVVSDAKQIADLPRAYGNLRRRG